MAKRFTDTNKYRKAFFRSLPGAYKLFWDYLYHDCDHAGIWNVDIEVAQIFIGKDMPINKTEALRLFNNEKMRIVELDRNKWFIPGFIEFQYGELKDAVKAHKSVLTLLKKEGITQESLTVTKGLVNSLIDSTNSCLTVKDKDKDKDKDMEIPWDEIAEEFNRATHGEKNYQLGFSPAGYAQIKRAWQHCLEIGLKKPINPIKAVIRKAMEKRAKDKALSPTGEAPMYYEPATIFNEEQFPRYLSECKPPKKEEKSA